MINILELKNKSKKQNKKQEKNQQQISIKTNKKFIFEAII